MQCQMPTVTYLSANGSAPSAVQKMFARMLALHNVRIQDPGHRDAHLAQKRSRVHANALEHLPENAL